MSGKLLMIYICNFHVLSDLLLICICKLHWNTELVRYPLPQRREKLECAARDIFWGLKLNTGLQVISF